MEELFDLEGTVLYGLAIQEFVLEDITVAHNRISPEDSFGEETFVKFLPYRNAKAFRMLYNLLRSPDAGESYILTLINRVFKPAYKFYNKEDIIDLREFKEILRTKGMRNTTEFVLQCVSMMYMDSLREESKEFIYEDSDKNTITTVAERLNFGHFNFDKVKEVRKNIKPEVVAGLSTLTTGLWPVKDSSMLGKNYISMLETVASIYKRKLGERDYLKVAKEKNLLTESLTDMVNFLETALYESDWDSNAILNSITVEEKEIQGWLRDFFGKTGIQSYDVNFAARLMCVKVYMKALSYHYKKDISFAQKSLEKVERDIPKVVEQEVILKQASSFSEPDPRDEELRVLRKQLERVQEDLEEANKNKQELSALREYMYSLDNSQEVPAGPSLEEMIDVIQQKRVVLVGGHPNWIKKVKDWIPSMKIIDASTKANPPYDAARTADMVFVFTYMLNHPAAWKCVEKAEEGKTKIVILGKEINDGLIIPSMYDKIKSLG